MKTKVYCFRVTADLLNSTVSVTKNKKEAIKRIKADDTCSNNRYWYSTDEYSEIVGEKKFPVPNEIVEITMITEVKRYKI
jgi:hypothetical protein